MHVGVVSCEFCLFTLMGLQFSRCWTPVTFMDECHVWIHSNTETALPLRLTSRRGAGEEAETGGNWAEVGKGPCCFPGEEKFGQSWKGSVNFSLSPSRTHPPESAGGSCFFVPSIFLHPLAPCLGSSPKSWHTAPQARTQPVALGLCLKIAQAPAICFCFSR